MKGSTEKTLITGITIAIFSVLAILLVSLWQYQGLRDTAARIRHTNQVLSQTKEIQDLGSRYELGVKNFLITGDLLFLDSLDGLAARRRAGIAQLKELTVDNAVQQRRIQRLGTVVERDELLQGQAIAYSRGKDFAAVTRLVTSSATTGDGYQIRKVCDSLVSEEGRLLAIRRAANQRGYTQLNVVLWVLSGVVLVLAVIFFQKTRVDLKRERQMKEQLSHFNTKLEERVLRQTAALQASEEKYRSLFFKSPLPKWIYDQESLRILEVNEAAVRNYGYSPEEFKAMSIKDIRPPEDHIELLRDVEAARAAPDEYRQNSWRHVKKDGQVIDVEVTAHSFEYEGRLARMVVMNDITERLHSERLFQELNGDLQKRAEELAASNSELERFAYVASHDLQEPLRMVSSFLQLLQKRYKGRLDEKADQYIHYAVDGAERMKALILDLLEYSRVGTGKEQFGPVDMEAVLGAVEDVFREKIVEELAHVAVRSQPLPVIRGDKTQLTQLLQNLVGNALKYHSDLPAELRIGVEERADHWLFSVRDNGIGIDPQFFDKIFVIFQRLNNRSHYAGTGIGLAICKKIVERHGGRIWVEPAPGQGSIFFFTIGKMLR